MDADQDERKGNSGNDEKGRFDGPREGKGGQEKSGIRRERERRMP